MMFDEILQKYFRGEISAPVAVMELLRRERDYDAVVSGLMDEQDPRLELLLDLLRKHERGCRQVVAMAKRQPAIEG